MNSILEDLSILIINPNPNFVYQLMSGVNYTVPHTTFAANAIDARTMLQANLPQLIIANDDCDKTPLLFREIVTHFTPTERPLLISVTDTPTPGLFEVSDQIVAYSHLPHIWQLIEALLIKANKADLLEKENRQLREELQRVNRSTKEVSLLKQAIVHSVSHELRTPMLQVKSAASLLKEDEGTNPTIIDLAMGAITRLEGGIRNVTLLNELMNESLDVEAFEPVLMMQILEAALRNLGRSWEHKEAVSRVKISVTPNTASVLCDRQRMIIAVQLLLDNALKFSEKTVTIKAAAIKDQMVISVQDYGIGIPEAQLDQIFEAFYQVDGSSTRRYGGMGIGLAIVRLIMEQHHTAINIRSTQGQGSTFTFTLSVSDYTNSQALN